MVMIELPTWLTWENFMKFLILLGMLGWCIKMLYGFGTKALAIAKATYDRMVSIEGELKSIRQELSLRHEDHERRITLLEQKLQ